MASKTVASNSHKEIVRREANFHSSLWGDQFVNYTFDNQMAEKLDREIKVMKDEVKHMLKSGTKMVEMINLIDTIELLGISYHFESEIDEKLEHLFHLYTKYEDNESYDLYTTALHFRLFR